MNQTTRLLVWLSRLRHINGFGIQSPTDFQFVRNVVCQKSPYYAYDQLDAAPNDWLQRKLEHLYLRLANWRQPDTIIDMVGAKDYLSAGCHKARFLEHAEQVDLACVPIASEYQTLFDCCNDQSVVVFQDIWKQWSLWHCIEYDHRAIITFDLYYCGIVLFDRKRAKQSYVVNF